MASTLIHFNPLKPSASSPFTVSGLYRHRSLPRKPDFDPSLPVIPPLGAATSLKTEQQHPLCTSALSLHVTRSNSIVTLLSETYTGRGIRDQEDYVVDRLFDLLRLSARYADAELAKAVHASVLKLQENTHLTTTLIDTYFKVGLCYDAYHVFLGLSSPDVVSYSTLISGFSKCNRLDEALHLFFELRESGIQPNDHCFVAILSNCKQLFALELGLQLHALVIKMGLLDFSFVANALMDFYAKCECYDIVLKLFEDMPRRDIVSWNTVISSTVKELMYEKAFRLFRDMQEYDTFEVDYFTLSTLLTACAGSNALLEGQEVHGHAIKIGLETNLSVGNSLLTFYTKCGTAKDVVALFQRMPLRDGITWTQMITAYMEFGSVDKAQQVFHEIPNVTSISYNALLAGFCQNGEGLKALNLFIHMVEECLEVTDFSLTSVLNACGLLMDLEISQQIHGFVVKFGYGSSAFIQSSLLDMYTRCGRMTDAQKLFHQSDQNNAIGWTSMVCGYARNGQVDEAISLVHEGQTEGKVVMDEVASISVLGLCGAIGFHELGKQIHCHAHKCAFLSNPAVGNSIVSMYSKCGDVDASIKMFDSMPATDTVSWNALIAGYLLNRDGDGALAVWSDMQKVGIEPDKVTFILVIAAYKHTNSNLVDNYRSLLFSLRADYGIEPTMEHYSSFIGVLGYWGLLEEAEDTIKSMPFEAEASVWRALLDSCRLHKNAVIGKRVAKRILAMEPRDPSTFILVSNLYSASGRWHCSEVVREKMREKRIRKHPGQSWIICQNTVHAFYARDKSHPQAKNIYAGLEVLILKCLRAGYVPDTSFVLHEVEEHQKKDFLFYHSSKLAATYGLLMAKPGMPIRIVKNILLCGDCHNFFKYVSVVTKRDIILRDSSGFHCFSGGQCSCKDYW